MSSEAGGVQESAFLFSIPRDAAILRGRLLGIHNPNVPTATKHPGELTLGSGAKFSLDL